MDLSWWGCDIEVIVRITRRRSTQPVAHIVVLLLETFGIRKTLSTNSLEKPRQKAETNLKTYELFINVDFMYITTSLCKYVIKILTP
jgi:hypothetical protein